MSNAIQFLDSLGSNQAFAVSESAYAAAIASLDVADEQRQALLDRDAAALNELLSGRRVMLCMVATPDAVETPDQADEFDDNGGDDDGDGLEDGPERVEHPG